MGHDLALEKSSICLTDKFEATDIGLILSEESFHEIRLRMKSCELESICDFKEELGIVIPVHSIRSLEIKIS